MMPSTRTHTGRTWGGRWTCGAMPRPSLERGQVTFGDHDAVDVYEDGFTAFMDGKMAVDNPWLLNAISSVAQVWFAGWLDAQWEILSKLKFTTGAGKPRDVNLGAQGAEFSDGRALDVTPKGKN